MAVVNRRAARVLVIDAESRLLLLRGVDPDRPQFPIWHAPGGGLAAGETDAEAAERELFEETGILTTVKDSPVWSRRLEFSFDGVRYDQHEIYFVCSVDRPDVSTGGRTEGERRYLSEHRWFTVEDLRSETDLLAPPDLAQRFDELLRFGPPTEPVLVGGAVLP